MARKKAHTPEEIVAKLRQAEVLVGQGKTVADAVRAIGVTEPIRRHPVLLAQAALTLSHLTKRPPILSRRSRLLRDVKGVRDGSQPS